MYTDNDTLSPLVVDDDALLNENSLEALNRHSLNYNTRTSRTSRNSRSVSRSLDIFENSVTAVTSEVFVPNMYSRDYIGLYCQYAAVGLLYGTSGALLSLCVYTYDGSPNMCANASNITFFAWNFKIIYAIITDIYRPFGLRRKPWMIGGWIGVLILLLFLAIYAHELSASSWLVVLLALQAFVMLSDVPADGYSVELGQLEPKEQRGTILATGQMVRFGFSIVAGVIQATLLNGPSTSENGCDVSFQGCWSWGLTINQYYALIFVLIAIIVFPIYWMKELDPSRIQQHTLSHFTGEVWITMQNLTTLYLLIFVIGTGALTNFTSVVNIYMQYYVIELTNFQAGIDTITTYLTLSVAIWIFKTYLINRNWRHTQYGSTIIASVLGFLWILVYYNIGGLQNPWFTIFIDLDQAFVQGIAQVLFSLSVIELSKPGLEATTYELLITVANAALTLSTIIATQLLVPLKAAGCTDDDGTCPSNSVKVTSPSGFDSTDGPHRYTIYCITITAISVCCCFLFTQFLPVDKDQCHQWREEGEKAGTSKIRGYCAGILCIVVVMVSYIDPFLLFLNSRIFVSMDSLFPSCYSSQRPLVCQL